MEEDEDNFAPAPHPFTPEPADDDPDARLAEWKRVARDQFERWLDGLEEIPAEAPPPEEPAETPGLFSFYEELAALRNEVRKANRRTAESFSLWGETLETSRQSLRSIELSLAANRSEEEPLSRGHCLALVELFDRLSRLGDALDKPPPPRRFFSGTAEWEAAWKNIRHGFAIVRDHTENLLADAGVEPIRAEGESFDPRAMVAVAVDDRPDTAPNTVTAIVAGGYIRNGEVLRPAEVKVTPRQT